MAKQRSTFGKIQREQEKRQKAAAKRERRAARSSGEDVVEDDDAPVVVRDQAAVLDALAKLYQQYEAGEMETDDFELRRDELRRQIDLG